MGLPTEPSSSGPLRRAEWRLRGDDPRGLFGWWWRGMVEEDRLMGLRMMGLVAMVGMFAAGIPGALFPMVATWLFAEVFVRKQKPNRLSAILPDPAPPGQFRTVVYYRRDRMTTGRDEMAMTFVEGWLYGEGLHSHFALRAEDIFELSTGSDRKGHLRLIDGGEIKITGLEDEPRVALERWYAARLSVPGVSTFPPARIHLQQYARWAAYLVAGPALGFLMSTVMVVFYGVAANHQQHGFLKLVVRLILMSISLYGLRKLFRLMKIGQQTRKAEEAVEAVDAMNHGPIHAHESIELAETSA